MKSPRQILKDILALASDELAAELPLIELADGVEAEVECGRSGTVTDMHGQTVEFTKENLAQLAERLNPDALVKIGHEKITTTTPHYGDVTGLRFDGEKDRLLAKILPTPALVRKNREEGFRRVSMELAAESLKGPFSFTGLAFLGAMPPAIKGLTPVSLAARAGERVFVFAEPEDDGRFEVEVGTKKAPAKKSLDTDETFDLAEREAEEKTNMEANEKIKADLAAAEEREKTQKAEVDRLRARLAGDVKDKVAVFMSAHVKRIPLKLRQAGLEAALMAAMTHEAAADPVVLKFSVPDGKDKTKEIEVASGVALAKWIIENLPEQTSKTEEVEVTKEGEEPAKPAADGLNRGVQFAKSEIHDKALVRLSELRKSNPKTTYTEALESVTDEAAAAK